ncbi:MAG: MOSC domain-containing protein [Methylococcales bacterium]|nr:MOSC domain-containing protein [Methylococcales bacterium]
MNIATQFLASVWRYPVKSMMGEELNAASLTDNGILGDRAYALLDLETDKIVSAKNPKKWPDIFSFHARYIETPILDQPLPPAWITLPDGDRIRSDQHDAEERMSNALKRSVSLRMQAPRQASLEQYWPEFDGEKEEISQEAIAGAAAEGSFFDYSTLHILTTASLTALQQMYPAGRMEARRFRPNLVIATDSAQSGFVENDWVGKVLNIDGVKLLVTDPCPRCVMPTLAQGDLHRDAGIMKIIAKNTVHVPFAGKSLPSVGVYAKVIKPGKIRRNSPVIIE